MKNKFNSKDERELLSCPGDTIKETLMAKNISLDTFASMMVGNDINVDDLLSGKQVITGVIAKELERALGIDAAFWINRERNYRHQLRVIDRQELMKEDPIRETFPGLLGKAFLLGYPAYIPGEGELGHAMMGALYEVLWWLHKEHSIYIVVRPTVFSPEGPEFSFSIILATHADGPGYIEVKHGEEDKLYTDWVHAHVDGLKKCLELVEQIKTGKK